MTILRWLRLTLMVGSAWPAAGAIGMLLCSAALLYGGYAWWGLSWLGSIAATVIVASVTTVIIDRLIVRSQRARLTTALESGQRQLETSCDNLIEEVNYAGEQVSEQYPKPPSWIPAIGFTSAGLDDSWRFSLGQLDGAVNAWTVLTGYGLRSLHLNAINDKLANLRDAYTEAMDDYDRLAEHMRSRTRLSFSLFAEESPQPQPDEDLVRAADMAVRKVTNVAREARAAIEDLKTGTAQDDLRARAARRRPMRLPRWLQLGTVMLAVAWAAVLVCAKLIPAAFPAGFLEDNLLDLTASAAIALFAGALTVTLVYRRRMTVAKNALPYYSLLVDLCLEITAQATPPGHPDLRRTLAKTADYMADLSSAIQNENPSAELTFWTRIVTDAMRRLGAAETPLFISRADADARFASLSRPSQVPDAGTQAGIAPEKAKASPGLQATHQLLSLLQNLAQLYGVAYAAATARRA